MRIIAGEHRGRRIEAPKGTETRPTSDFVRETAFNLIGPRRRREPCSTSTPARARSGSRRSRAARRAAVFVDSSREACRTIGAEPREARAAGHRALPGRRARARGRARPLRPDPRRPALQLHRLRAPRAAHRPAPRPRRPRRPPDPGRGRAGPRRASKCVPPAGTAPHALRCSSCDHRNLPRLVRPRHERPRRRDPARRPDLRPRRRRRRRQPAAQDAPCSRSRSASTLLREAVAPIPNVEVDVFKELVVDFARRWEAHGDRQGPPRDLRLRVRVPDEPAEPDARARDRDACT